MHRILLALAALTLIGAAKPSPVADYQVSPVFNGSDLSALDVVIHMAADPSGTTRLDLPDSNGGATNLWRYLKDLSIEGADSVAEDGPAKRVVKSAPGAPLVLHYRVVSAFDHDPGPEELDTYRPTLRPRWFWAYGEALFIRAKGEVGLARFHWTGAPAGFPFASDLEHPAGRPMPVSDLVQSVLVGGPDLTVAERPAEGAPVRIAMIGDYARFSHEAFADMAARVIAGERRFWGSKEGPFLVALAPLVPVKGTRSTRGEGRGDAFSIMTTSDIPLENLTVILAHQYFHTWNPGRLGGMQDGTAERADYWFSEGFTDFYARRLMLRTGQISLEAFAAEWNAALGQYASSSARTAPNSRVVEAFWTDHAVEKLPYQRGSILAATWDSELRNRSRGRTNLDDVLHAMRIEAEGGKDRRRTAPVLFAEAARRFGLDVRAKADAVIQRGEPALLPADAFGTCLTVETRTQPVLDYGFDVNALGTARVIKGVKPDHPAYAAGLRDGMVLVRRESPDSNDSRTILALRVKADGVEQVIRYRPEGKAEVTLQTVVVPPNLTQERRAACTAEAAGGT